MTYQNTKSLDKTGEWCAILVQSARIDSFLVAHYKQFLPWIHAILKYAHFQGVGQYITN